MRKKECALNGKVCNLPGVLNEDQAHLETFVHETNLFTMQEVMLKCEEHWQKEFGKVRLHLDAVAIICIPNSTDVSSHLLICQ